MYICQTCFGMLPVQYHVPCLANKYFSEVPSSFHVCGLVQFSAVAHSLLIQSEERRNQSLLLYSCALNFVWKFNLSIPTAGSWGPLKLLQLSFGIQAPHSVTFQSSASCVSSSVMAVVLALWGAFLICIIWSHLNMWYKK